MSTPAPWSRLAKETTRAPRRRKDAFGTRKREPDRSPLSRSVGAGSRAVTLAPRLSCQFDWKESTKKQERAGVCGRDGKAGELPPPSPPSVVFFPVSPSWSVFGVWLWRKVSFSELSPRVGHLPLAPSPSLLFSFSFSCSSFLLHQQGLDWAHILLLIAPFAVNRQAYTLSFPGLSLSFFCFRLPAASSLFHSQSTDGDD